MVYLMSTRFEAQVDYVRRWLDRLERGSLPDSIKSVAGFVRRLGRILFRAREKVRVRMIRRNVLYPIRNFILRDQPLVVQAGGQSFLLAPKGAVPLEMWSGRWFEKQEIDFVLGTLRPGMTFVDAGANVGIFSIPAAKKLGSGIVLAFEPCRWTYDRLVENARLNGLTNLLGFHSALGDYDGQAVLRVNVAGKDGLNTLGEPAHEDSDVVGTEIVPITTLDDFLRKRSIRSVDVMKIDVEGAELFVLRGARELLERPGAPLILYESGFLSKGFNYHPVEPMWLLEKYGYSFFVIDSGSGKVSALGSSGGYGAMIIAVKPSHPQYTAIRGNDR
jgi:FkbM family methyltransferase